MSARIACCVALLLAVLPVQTVRADEPRLLVYANLGIGNNRDELAAQTALRAQLDRFVRWINAQRGLHRNYAPFDVRFIPTVPPQLRGSNPQWERNLVAVVWATSTGQGRVRAQAEVDIGRPEALSSLRNPANVFQPVLGVITLGNNPLARVRMYEAVIIYSVLVRAFEDGVRARGTRGGPLDPIHLNTVNLIAVYLRNTIIADARKIAGSSTRCLDLIDANVPDIQRGAADSNIRRRFRPPPSKLFNC